MTGPEYFEQARADHPELAVYLMPTDAPGDVTIYVLPTGTRAVNPREGWRGLPPGIYVRPQLLGMLEAPQ